MLAVVALQLVLAAGPTKKIKIAIPEMRVAGGVSQETANLLTDVVAKAIQDVRPDRIQVITSTMMQSILGLERQKQLLGCKEDSSCLVEVGNALGADLLVAGSLGKLGSTYLLSFSVIDLAKSQPDRAVERTFPGPDDNLITNSRSAGREIGEMVAARLRAADGTAQASLQPTAPGLGRPGGPTPQAPPQPAQPQAKPANQPAGKAYAAAPAAPINFPGRVPGFPYELYPAPRLDPDASARYLRGHH